ncbi:EmrB/QacA subfamily drug resistance transporter [Paenibacillus cellulosilyticus]|uniref:EmrB/QacA subfamily drug resistance transporter n=1 Tax=Paenibacillus cellulosilyticus TaxID=375489 RepID=A0A2V2YRY6_9BACL|nr:DHA2 family efflux MFS transporter permease subunit [Paenibacillus cellulosilyticus]PWV99385.1 EmrB/QacA subfamily drug resistance transporter [Paenibacillus cellulosilyticus]QKS45146.1 DHA2 family efflux MFS transporter permease subunit [Paenibacillus cellulosilyticus]
MDHKKRLYWTLSALLVGLFLSSLDQTIVSTALPTIVQHIGGLEHISWVFTAYMLTSTSVMPIAGKLSDMYGRKRFYMIGLLLFLVGSLLCGISQTMTQLILFRGLQGIGGGMMAANTFALLFSMMPMGKVARIQSLFMSVLAMSSILGPSIGAFITSQWDWRWNFFINAPIGIIAILIIGIAMKDKEPEENTKRLKVDYSGAMLLVTTTVSILLALKMGGADYAWRSWPIIGLFVLGAAALIAFLLVERRASEPILPLDMFTNRTVAGTAGVTFIQGSMMFGALLYTPLFVQGGLGGNVADAGNAMTPMMAAVMAGATLSSFMIRRFTWRSCALLSMLLAGAGLYIMTNLPLETSKWTIRGDMALIGIGLGIMMPIAQMAITSAVDPRYRGVANSTVTFTRNIGGVFGSALMAVIVNHQLNTSIEESDQIRLASAIHLGFWFLVSAAIIGVIIASLMGHARYVNKRELPHGEAVSSIK